MSVFWLRYGKRRTGFEVRLFGGHVGFGLRWSRCVFNAPAGPFLYTSTGIRLDAWTLNPRRVGR